MSTVPSHYGAKLPAGLKPPTSYESAAEFFGWDEEKYQVGEDVLPAWPTQLAIVRLPALLHYTGKPVQSLRIHPKCAPYLSLAYGEIHAAGLWHFLDPYAGSYNFRLQRGGETLSAHAFGAAVDHDPKGNPLRCPMHDSRFAREDGGMTVVRIFEEHGFFWGARWSRPDPMHFQFGIGF